MNEIQKVVASLKEDIVALEAMLPDDKPCKWRLWDMATINTGKQFIRCLYDPQYPWQHIGGGVHTASDAWINKQNPISNGNLADKLAQGDVLPGLTKEEAIYAIGRCRQGMASSTTADKLQAALDERKEESHDH